MPPLSADPGLTDEADAEREAAAEFTQDTCDGDR